MAIVTAADLDNASRTLVSVDDSVETAEADTTFSAIANDVNRPGTAVGQWADGDFWVGVLN